MPDEPKNTDGNESDLEFELEVRPAEDSEEQGKKSGKAVDPREVLGGNKKRVSVAGEDVKRRYKARLFSLKNNRMKKSAINLAAPASRSFDYEEIYEDDEYGKEAFPEARVWKVHNDETQLFDQERIDAWRDALDVLLVFIGLFSAIVTAFVLQTSETLQPDYAQLNVIVTLEILRTMTNSTIPNSAFSSTVMDPHFGQATPSRTDKVVNGLWFTSLTVSLSTALLTVLTKQWLYHYTTSTSGTSRERARIRQFRYGGLEAYQLPRIIDLLPILLHLALALFLIGLTIFLSPLHEGIAGIVGGITALSYTLYLVSVYLPIHDPRCPYKSPLSFYAYALYHMASAHARQIIAQPISTLVTSPTLLPLAIGTSLVSFYFRVISSSLKAVHRLRTWASDVQTNTPSTLSLAEMQRVRQSGQQLDVDAMVYLYNTSANSTVRTITLEAFCGLAPSDADTQLVYNIVEADLSDTLRQCTDVPRDIWGRLVLPPAMWRKFDRLLRALCAGNRGELNVPFDDIYIPNFLTTGDTEQMEFFRCCLLPSLFSSPLLLSIQFAQCLDRQLPLPIWAQAIRTAIYVQPTDHIMRSILLGCLHNLSVDQMETGAVKLDAAMRRPSIRRLALSYLGIIDVAKEDIQSLFLSFLLSFRDLLLQEGKTPKDAGRVLWNTPSGSDALSFSLDSLACYIGRLPSKEQWERDISPEQVQLITSILERSLKPTTVVEDIPWKVVLSATKAWISASSIAAVTSTSLIHNILHRFRPRPLRRNPPFLPRCDNEDWDDDGIERDKDLIVEAVEVLVQILSSLPSEFAPTILQLIQKQGMLAPDIATGGNLSSNDLFWSPWMVEILLWKIGQVMESSGAEEEWFRDMLSSMYITKSLEFLSKQLLRNNFYKDYSSLHQLCHLQPHHSSWPAVFESMLLLFDDQAYLNSMNYPMTEQKQALSEALNIVKSILEKHHPSLGDSKFDIPQFDDSGNVMPWHFGFDDILEDSEPLRSLQSVDPNPHPRFLDLPEGSQTRLDMMQSTPSPHNHPFHAGTSIHYELSCSLAELDGSRTDAVPEESHAALADEAASQSSEGLDSSRSHIVVEAGVLNTDHPLSPPENVEVCMNTGQQLQSTESSMERGEGVNPGALGRDS